MTLPPASWLLGIWLAFSAIAPGQQLAVRSGAAPGSVSASSDIGKTETAVAAITRTQDLLIVARPDVLQSEDIEPFRTFVTAVFQAVHAKISLRLGIVNGNSVDIAGPFRSAQELRSVLRATNFDGTARQTDATGFTTGLATPLEAIPAEWGYTLIVGRIPQFSAAGNPEVEDYAAAFLTSRFVGQKRSLLFWDPTGVPVASWAQKVARNTAGFVFQTTGELTQALLAEEMPVKVMVSLEAPRHGFRLAEVKLEGIAELGGAAIPMVATANRELPSIEQFAELRALTERLAGAAAEKGTSAEADAAARAELARALAIDPADWTAVSLGIALTERQKDAAAEIRLLEEAVELKPGEPSLWRKLGDLQYDRREFADAEKSLLQARAPGVKDARLAEQLGRIRYASQDYAGAAPLIDESLALNGTQQPLWLLAAEIAQRMKNSQKQAQALEKALALGGHFPDKRAELIRIYLTGNDKERAGRNADLELPFLPDDAETQATWATFYAQLGRPDDALSRWRKVVQLDGRREEAHAAIASILLDSKHYPEALAAAESGLQTASTSARLELSRAVALEHLDRFYEARHSLEKFGGDGGDIALLRHRAELTDTYGGGAGAAYLQLSAALGKSGAPETEVRAAVERGLKVALRDGDTAVAAELVSRLPKKDDATAGKTKQRAGIWIPGGLDALMFAALGPGSPSAGTFLTDYCRTLLAHQRGVELEPSKIYRKQMADYFAQLKGLLAVGTKTGNRTLITLSMSDKRGEKQAETVLALLGWKVRRNKQEIVVESDAGASHTSKQDLAAALAIDQGGMQKAFQAGKPFRVEIAWDWAPIGVDEAVLRNLTHYDTANVGLPEALAAYPDLARFYMGMSNLDAETGAVLVMSVAPEALATRYAGMLSLYAQALGVAAGRVLSPGGPQADAVWTALAGVSPTDTVRFVRALFVKDDGKLLAYFSAVSQLDFAHQRFFMRSAKRAEAFYKLFADSDEMRNGPGKQSRKGSFAEFLRSVPLNDDGTVDFPGGAEVWMVAKGDSKSAGQAQKMLRKVKKTVAPEVEDEILLHIASTRYMVRAERMTELDNFLAVAHIDAHRTEPLDQESALLLAQNLQEFSGIYPYFAAFPELTAQDYKMVFAVGAKLLAQDELDVEQGLGQFYSLLELTRTGVEFGQLTPEKGMSLLRGVLQGFTAAQGAAGYTAATLDSLRALTGNAADADGALMRLVTGETAAVELEWNGARMTLDAGRRRSVAFGRVLNLQKVPSVSKLLEMGAAARTLAAQKGKTEELAAVLVKDASALPNVEIPKSDKFTGKPRQALERANPAKLVAKVNELQERVQRKKVNPKETEKLAGEILAEMGPQVRLALAGNVYAAYLSPEDSLVANDPLLLRKHEAFELRPVLGTKPGFAQSELVVSSANGGSYFVGGFGYFSRPAGKAAAMGVRSGNPDDELYAQQMAATRMTPWSRYRDEDQRLLGLRVRMVREWLVYAASQPALLRDLSDDTLGILSLSRRRDLLKGIAAEDWNGVWRSVTLSDLLALSVRYSARYPQSPWHSPLHEALAAAASHNDGARLNLLGPVALELNGCSHPHLLTVAPYEEYERHLFPSEMAERSAEMKLYLSELMDRLGLPAGALASIAEPATAQAFKSIHMSDDHDWMQAMSVFRGLDEKTVGAALEAVQ
jgi:Flp pilus assembly protein TadD